MQACSSRSSSAQQASPDGSLQSLATRCAPMCARSYMDSLRACTRRADPPVSLRGMLKIMEMSTEHAQGGDTLLSHLIHALTPLQHSLGCDRNFQPSSAWST